MSADISPVESPVSVPPPVANGPAESPPTADNTAPTAANSPPAPAPPDPDVVLARLEAERASRMDTAKLLRDVDIYAEQTKQLDFRIVTITSARHELQRVEAELPGLETWRTNLESWRKALCDELLGFPNRMRTPEQYGRQQNVTLSMRMIDFNVNVDGTGWSLSTLRLGSLMRASGYTDPLPWLGCLRETERRIKILTEQRDAAQVKLDYAIMSDADRAAHDAEVAERCRILNAAPRRLTRVDGSIFDRYPDGREVEIEDGTTEIKEIAT